MLKKNLSQENGADSGSIGRRWVKAQTKAQTEAIAFPKNVSVLDKEAQPHGLVKAWLEYSRTVHLSHWGSATLAAAREIANSPSDLVLVGSCLARDRGIQCAYLLKQLRADLIVIVLTDAPDLATCIRCYQAGADAYVTMPPTVKVMEETILDAVSGFKPFPREICKVIAEHWARRFTLPDGNLLSPSQAEVMAGLVSGKLDKEIADERGISKGTVHAITHSIYIKLGARSRSQAVARFLPLGEAFSLARQIDRPKRSGALRGSML